MSKVLVKSKSTKEMREFTLSEWEMIEKGGHDQNFIFIRHIPDPPKEIKAVVKEKPE